MISKIDLKLAGLWSDSGYALQLVLAILIVIVIATSSRWRRKKKSVYQRRTSQASAMGANRQLLEEISGMKQNVINVRYVCRSFIIRYAYDMHTIRVCIRHHRYTHII